MNILRITGDIYPEVIGGVGLHTYFMSKLQAKEHNITVYTCGKKNYSRKIKNFNLISFKPLTRIFGNPIVFRLFYNIYKNANNFDIVHAHSHLFFTTNICSFLKKIKKFKLIITSHGLYSQTAPIFFQKIYMKTLGKFTLNSADAIICYTESEKKELIELGINESKINVIHNGVNIDFFRKKRQDKKYGILWVGRFVEGKGIIYLNEILRKVILNYNTKVLIVGDGPLKKSFIKDVGNEHIEYINNISYDKMPSLYNKSEIFILPSINEGVPRTILESMSCEVPVISADLPQLKNIIDNSGFLINPKDTSLFAEKILFLLKNKKIMTKLGKRGREIISKNFSWVDTVDKTVELYKKIIRNNQKDV